MALPKKDGDMLQVVVKPPLSKVRAAFKRRFKEIGDLRGPNKRAATFLDRWVQINFRTEGGKVGGWFPIEHREGRILQDTGRLRNSFLPFADAKRAGIGSRLPYSKKHERGDKVHKRRMLPKSREVRGDLTDIYEGHVKKLTRKPLWTLF